VSTGTAEGKQLVALASVATILGVVIALAAWLFPRAAADDSAASTARPPATEAQGGPAQGQDVIATAPPTSDGATTSEPPAGSSDAGADAGADDEPDEKIPEIAKPPKPEPVYLRDIPRTNPDEGIIQKGKATINGTTYLKSVYLCSELSSIPNINCNSDETETWSPEYAATPQARTFTTVIGLSDKSPGDCQVAVRVAVGGETVFSEQLTAGSQYPREWPAKPGTRVVLSVTPVASHGRCITVFADARFVP
jgi:hypothetical protein